MTIAASPQPASAVSGGKPGGLTSACGTKNRHYAVVVRLLDGQVGQPGPEHAGRVVQVGRGGGEDHQVAGPAQPLVALRAIGGHVDEVAAHAPDDVLVQPGHVRIRAREGTGGTQIGMHDNGFQVIRR